MKYLTQIIKTFILLIGFGLLTVNSFAAKSNQTEISNNLLYGTWCDLKTNEWIIGFFDKITVYENQAWFYQIISEKKGTYRIELKKGDKTKTVTVKLTGKNKKQCELTDNKSKTRLVFTPKPLPYSYPDTKSFVDNGYNMDTVTIHGYLKNVPNKEKPFSIIYTNILSSKQEELQADIDENGLFTIQFPVLNTTRILVDWRRIHFMDIVEPGETYFIYVDFAENQSMWGADNAIIWLMGDNARLHREMAKSSEMNFLKKEYPYSNSNEHIGKMDEYLEVIKDVFNYNSEVTKQYIADNPVLSDRMQYYLEKSNLFDFAFYLMQSRFGLDRTKNQRLSDEHMQLAGSIMSELPKPLTLNDAYVSTFLTDYTNYIKELNLGRIFINEADALIYFDKQGNFPLSDTQRKAVKNATKIEGITKVLEYSGVDKEKQNEARKPYQEDLEIYYSLINDTTFKQLFENEWENAKQKAGIIKEIEQIEALNVFEKLSEILLMRYAFFMYNAYRIPFENEAFNLLCEQIKHSQFKVLLQEEQQKFIDFQAQSIRHIESLKNTDHLKDIKDANELLKKLTEPYLGKVIHIDFWGVWCSPCKRQMKFAGKVKEGLKGEDVVFMYFANHSPENSWKNVIKEYDLTGENVVHYNLPDKQQEMLERLLGVDHYPTYMIMDKTGKIVDTNPPLPIDTEDLINELKKWTEK